MKSESCAPGQLRSTLLAVLFVATVAAPCSADLLYLSCAADARLQPGSLFGLGVGPRVGVAWEPGAPLRLEAALAMRRFTAWEIAGDIDLFWLPVRLGRWRPGVGLVVEAAYGTGFAVSSSSSASPPTWPAGPFWSAAAGLCLAPLDFHLGSFDLSFLRLSALVRRAPDRFVASLGSTLFALRVPIAGGRR